MVIPLAKITSDHIPCKVTISTAIPKASIFRFENYWPDHPGFYDAVQRGWNMHVRNSRDSATVKNVRHELKVWSRGISNLNILIANCNKVILFLDTLEEIRSLFAMKFSFRKCDQGPAC